MKKIIARFQKMFDLPEGENFSGETYEHIQQISNKSRIYFHICDSCKLRSDSDEEKQACPRCKQSTKNIGFEIREFEPNIFWGKFKYIKQLIP